MFTPRTISATVTRPLWSQSPMQAAAADAGCEIRRTASSTTPIARHLERATG